MTSKEDVYGAFVDYYGDIKMVAIKDDNSWVVYAARSHSGLNENRYIFAIVPKRFAPGPETTFNNLDWISLQTRTTDDVHPVPTHHLYVDHARKQVLQDNITAVDRTEKVTTYITDTLPIRVQLLHDPKKKNHLQYPDQAKLYQAMETYRCVIELL